jgi:UTP-glucose-1-phosphate uridylyltransferase
MTIQNGSKDLIIRAERITLNKTQGEFHDIGFGNDFLDITLKTQATKENIDKLDFTEIKSFIH